jgi:hypothetical protein
VRYLEQFADKRSHSDDKDHLKKLDRYLRSLKLDAIDMTALQPFIRDRKSNGAACPMLVDFGVQQIQLRNNLRRGNWPCRGKQSLILPKPPRCSSAVPRLQSPASDKPTRINLLNGKVFASSDDPVFREPAKVNHEPRIPICFPLNFYYMCFGRPNPQKARKVRSISLIQ